IAAFAPTPTARLNIATIVDTTPRLSDRRAYRMSDEKPRIGRQRGRDAPAVTADSFEQYLSVPVACCPTSLRTRFCHRWRRLTGTPSKVRDLLPRRCRECLAEAESRSASGR